MLKPLKLPRCWLALTGLTLLTRLPALLYPRAIDDEAVYAVVARVMLHGGLPYRDAIERKPPLLFAVYWAVFRLFGEADWLALHLVAVAWVLLTMGGLAVLAEGLQRQAADAAAVSGEADRAAGRSGYAGVLAALAYCLVEPFATAKNLAFNGEVLMNLPLVWAYALILARRSPSHFVSFAAGALLATAFLLKQPAAIAAIPLGLYLLTTPLWRGHASRARAIGQTAALAGGFAAVLGTSLAILSHFGLLAEAWYWTMTDHTVPHIFWQHGIEHSALFLLMALPLIAPLAMWHPLRSAWRGLEPEFWTVLGWLAVSLVGAAAGGRFYPHYYIQLVPPLAVLAAIAYGRTANPRRPSLKFAAIWLAVAGSITLVVQAVQLLAERNPSAAGHYVAVHAAVSDRLFVWGQQTPFYLDADRLPASRYIATYPLTGYIFGGPLPGVSTRDRILPGAWPNLAADFARHPPQFIIDSEARPGAAYPIRDFPLLADRLARDYQAIASFPDGTVYRRRQPAAPPYSGFPRPIDALAPPLQNR